MTRLSSPRKERGKDEGEGDRAYGDFGFLKIDVMRVMRTFWCVLYRGTPCITKDIRHRSPQRICFIER